MGGMIFLVIIILLALWILASCIRIVPQAYAIVLDEGAQVYDYAPRPYL